MKKRLNWYFLTFGFGLLLSQDPFCADTPWMPEINTLADYESLSITDNSRSDLLRTTKFLSPAKDDPLLLQTVFQNVNQYLLHLEFLIHEFPERFSGLTPTEYMDMVINPQTRTYYAGAIYQFHTHQGELLYGFNVYSTPNSSLQPDDILNLYIKLAQSMKLRPFAFSPMTPAEIEQTRQWTNPGFPIYLPTGLIEPEYEAYSPSVNYGRIRRFTLDDLDQAVAEGQIGWQDIVVIDSAPTDIETVVAGIITGTRQGELSHVNVRSIRRGTPNAYIQKPLEVFQPYEGELIKLSILNDKYEIEFPVDLLEAEDWWNEHRPKAASLQEPDDEFDQLVSLPDMKNLDFFDSLSRRFGGKASQLGLLYSVFSDSYFNEGNGLPFLVDGFAIPFRYYHEFMLSNLIPHPTDSNALVTYEEFIQILLFDTRFRSDTKYRTERLDYFIEYMRDHGEIDPALIQTIINKITEVYGSVDVKVRFRSSSNAEDDIAFNGAGLYDSTSVCARDSLDEDNKGPSHCDEAEQNERTIERGLKRVWASLWKPKAFEERDYYQIDHLKSRMGTLVSRAYPAEDCNGVAFTGDPITGRKDYYVINVQLGDESVVQPGTGVIPEKDILKMEWGSIREIQRARKSSLTEDNQWILSDDQLQEMVTYLSYIDDMMPVDTQEFTRDQIFFDIEFKYDKGQFVIKQIRPTLMASTNQPPVQVEKVTLNIPNNVRMASTFNMSRTIREEYGVHSMIHLIPGLHSLPVQSGEFELNLIERFEFGPQRIVALPQGSGIIKAEVFNPPVNNLIMRYEYNHSFLIQNKKFTLTIQGMQVENENKSRYEVIFDNELIINQLHTVGQFEGGSFEELIDYKTPSDDKGLINLHDLVLENGQRIRLYENIRHRLLGTGFVYANLVYADMLIGGESIRENDYWNLVYTAQGHCWNAKFWVLFEHPIGDTYGVAVLTTTKQWGAITEAEVFLLDSNLEHLRKLEIISYTKEEVERIPDPNTKIELWSLY